jgi:DNA invertase Pin-like site-specific DNA recombinase
MALPTLIAEGMAAAKRKGRHMGRAPFGWRIDAQTGALTPDDAEQAVIQRIDAARAAGLSWRAAADALNAAGARTRSGAAWQNRSAQRVAERAAELRKGLDPAAQSHDNHEKEDR